MAAPYQAQLGPAATETNFSGASPEDAGAAVGRGLEQAGDTVDRAIHQFKERNRDMEAADAGVKLAQASQQIDQAATDARTNAAPGAAGHTQNVVSQLDDMSANNLGAIKDPKIRAAFAQRYAELRDRVGSQEYGWEAGQRVKKLVTDVDSAGTQYANAQASSPNPGAFVQSLHDVQTTIGSLAVDDDTKTKLVKEQQRKIANAFGNGLVDQNPQAVVAMLDKGQLNPYLEPEDIKTMRSAADVEIRRRDAAARQKRSQDEANARENIQLIGKRISSGDYSVSDAEFNAAGDDAKKYGLKGPAFDLSDWKDKRDVVRETRDWTPGQWHSAINDLSTKQADGKSTTADGVRLKHLQELGGPAIDRFNSNPAAAAAAAGNPEPQVDWSNPDPGAVQKRIAWARSFAGASGMQDIPYLDPDEMKPLRERLAQGGAGQLEVASQLRNTFGTGVGTEIAKQLNKSDKSLQLFIGLEPQAAQLVHRGMDALQRNPKLFAGGQGDDVRARDIFNEYAAGIPPEMRDPVYNAAKNITAAAGDAVHRSSLEGDEFEATFRNAIQRAAGQVGDGNDRTGGFVNWNGRRAWLPPAMGQGEFQQRLSRADAGAWKQAGAGAPYYMGSNGKLAPLSDVQLKQLGRYSLESVSPGVYQPVGPDGGHLVDEHGRPWSFDVRKLGH